MNYNVVNSVGDYAVILMLKKTSDAGIVSSHGNVGRCISCAKDPSINNRQVMFNGRNKYERYGDFVFVPYSDIFCVVN